MTAPLYSPRVRYLCSMLTKRGVDVQIVTEKVGELPSDLPCACMAVQFYNGSRLDWMIKSVGALLFDYKNKYFARKIEHIAEEFRPDVVMVSTCHTFGLCATKRVAEHLGIPYHVDLRDIAEQSDGNPLSDSLVQKLPLVGALYKRVNIRRRNKVVAAANAVSTVSEWHRNLLARINENSHLVYNGYDESRFVPRHRHTDCFDIIYTGKVYDTERRNPRPLFAALRNMMEQGSKIMERMRLVFYTSESDQEKVKVLAEEYGLLHLLTLHSYVANKEVVDIISGASVLLTLTNLEERGVLTTKFFEAIGVRVPVLCVTSNNSELSDMVAKHNCGLATHDAKMVEEFLNQRYEEWEKNGYTEMHFAGAEQHYFSREVQTTKLVDILDKLAAI